MPRITAVDVVDIRFPTTQARPGSRPASPDEEHSIAYVELRTDTDLTGHGLASTVGRINPSCVLAARHVAAPLVGRDVDDVAGSLGRTYRELAGDSRPDAGSGVARPAATAVLTAVWDLVARHAGKPLWRLVSEMEPADLVAACDFEQLSDVLPANEALEMLDRLAPSRAQRVSHLTQVGYPAYTSARGWLGHTDAQLEVLCRNAVADGWHAIKVEVGDNFGRIKRRLAIAREALGPDATLLIDAKQRWHAPEAISEVAELASFGPLWIDEPTRPDDIVGHAAIRAALSPVGVATGGRCDNRVMVKQMVRAGAVDYCQIDASRLASVNEIVPMLLLAAKFGVPVCYTGGGAGLSELVQHIAMIDFVCVSGSLIGRLLEHVDVLHQHFSSPPVVDQAWYRPPVDPGYSARMRPDSLAMYHYPDGTYWRRVMTQR
jgi:L-fuconate dehydratase